MPNRPWLWMALLMVVFGLSQPHDLWKSLEHVPISQADLDDNEKDRAALLAGAAESGGSGRRIGMLLLGCAAIVSLKKQKAPRFYCKSLLGVMCLAIVGMVLCSVVWSGQHGLAARRIIVFALLCLGAIAVARRFDRYDLMLFVVVSGAFFLVLGVLMEIQLGTFRPWQNAYRFSGTLHPNQQGICLALLALASFACAVDRTNARLLFVFIGVMAVLFLLLTGSRTAVASFILGMSIFFFLVIPLRSFVLVTTVAASMGLLLALAYVVVNGEKVEKSVGSALMLGRASEQSESGSLNGRIPLWIECGRYVIQRPVLGYGYQSFWTPKRIQAISRNQGWSLNTAHNGYIDVALELGIPGLTLFVGVFSLAILKGWLLFRCAPDTAGAFAVAALIWCAANSMSESLVFSPGIPSFVTVVLVISIAFQRPVPAFASDKLPTQKRQASSITPIYVTS